jgi:hypothetical protein
VPVALLADSYAMQAARRAEKRRLCCFVRLLDYLLADAIRSLVVRSQQHMLSCLGLHHAPGHEAQPQEGLDSSSHTPVPSSAPEQQQQLVLQLEVLLDARCDQLLLQPQAGQFVEALAVWQRSVERAVRAVPCLLSDAQLQVCLGGCPGRRLKLEEA